MNSITIDVPHDGVLVVSGQAFVSSNEGSATTYTIEPFLDGSAADPLWGGYATLEPDPGINRQELTYTLTIPVSAGTHSVSQRLGGSSGGAVDFFYNHESLTVQYYPGASPSTATPTSAPLKTTTGETDNRS